MAADEFRRPQFDALRNRVEEPRGVIQVLSGPRQTGKTTLARQVMAASALPSHYASADDPMLQGRHWLQAAWDRGRLLACESARAGGLLVLDEVQKIPGWSEAVKRLWDEDTRSGAQLRVMLLGSAPLLLGRGLSESLAGRFELIRLGHWTLPEMREAFGTDLDGFLFYGSYPGAARFVDDLRRWRSYVRDSLIETTISRDVLLMAPVEKPALLRQLMGIGCEHSGHVLSYNKMLGQLQDAGNTTTLAHYLELLGGAGLLTGLSKYSGSTVRRRGSSPKLIALNNALVTAHADIEPEEARRDPQLWGRLAETAVGAHLVSTSAGEPIRVHWWRERNCEVDFVLRRGSELVAIEVTTGRRKSALPGIDAFAKSHPLTRTFLVGAQGTPLEEFLSRPASDWFR